DRERADPGGVPLPAAAAPTAVLPFGAEPGQVRPLVGTVGDGAQELILGRCGFGDDEDRHCSTLSPEPGDFRRGGWVFSRLDVVRDPHEPVTCARVMAAQGEVDVGVKRSEQAVAAAEEDRRDGNSDLVDELRGEEGLDGLPAVDVGALGTEAAEKRGRLLNVVGGLDAEI